MASLTERPTSRFFVACFTDRHGRRLKRSTATADCKQAQKIADEYEAAARRKRTAFQVRRVITQLHHEITGEEVSQTSPRNFIDAWLERCPNSRTLRDFTKFGDNLASAKTYPPFLVSASFARWLEILR